MKAEERLAIKEEFMRVIVEHLTPLGYPDEISREEILAELPALWKKCEGAGIIREGMTYEEFVLHAKAEALAAELEEIMG